MAQVIDCLPSNYQTLISNPVPAKNKKKLTFNISIHLLEFLFSFLELTGKVVFSSNNVFL
jgi:hypothetical protein